MNRPAKEKVYSVVYQSLKANQAITDLGYPEEQKRKHYDFKCSVGPVNVSFRLNSENDTYMIRGVFPCGSENTNEINRFINGLEGKEGYINAFVGDNHYGVISISSTVAGLDDEVAMKKIEKEADAFFSFLIKNKDAIVAYQSKVKGASEEKDADPRPKKKDETPKKEKTAGIPPILANAVSGMQKPKGREEKKREEITPTKKEEPATIQAKEPAKLEESALKEEKAAFRQYKKDQEHLMKAEKEKMLKQQGKLDKELTSLEEEKKSLTQEKTELSRSKDALCKQQKALETEKSKFEKQLLGFEKEQANFKKEKDAWDSTTLDERLVQRRKDLEELENNLYKKEEGFQTFQETTLADIKNRMEEADKKEKDLIKKEELFNIRDAKIKDAEMDIELRYKKLEDKEKTAAKKEVELSDKEADIRRTEIVKKDAENKLKQLEIVEKNLTNRKEQLNMKESELQKRQEAFEKKYHQAMEDLASLDRKQEKLKTKEAELRTLFGENEKLEEQLKELKDNTAETRKLLDTKDASIKGKEKSINNLKDTIKSLKETVTQTQQKNKALSEEKKSLQGKLKASDEKKSTLEDEIAKVRSDLYDVKEKLQAAKSSDSKLEKNMPEHEELTAEHEKLKAENEKLKAEIEKASCSYQASMGEMSGELDISHNKISELEGLLEEANMAVEELKKNPIPSFDFDPDAIGAKEIVGERQGLYAVEKNDCTVYIDAENQVLQFKKTVRRPSKHTKSILSWNKESINETYFITQAEVCCRKTCRHGDRITDEMQNVLERLGGLK